MKRIALAMPAYRMIDQRCVLSLMALASLFTARGIDVVPIVPQQCAWLDVTQNFIMHQFYESGADGLLFVDDDIIFQAPDALKLVESGRDVVGGDYRLKCKDVRWVCDRVPNGRVDGEYVECGLIGLGFSYITRAVIEAMRALNLDALYTAGDDTPTIAGKPTFQLFAPALQQGVKWDPDSVFFNRLRAAGFTPWCDTSIKLGHLGTHVYEAP